MAEENILDDLLSNEHHVDFEEEDKPEPADKGEEEAHVSGAKDASDISSAEDVDDHKEKEEEGSSGPAEDVHSDITDDEEGHQESLGRGESPAANSKTRGESSPIVIKDDEEEEPTDETSLPEATPEKVAGRERVEPPHEEHSTSPRESRERPERSQSPAKRRGSKTYDYSTKLNYLFREARFFLIKSNNSENVALSKAKGVWSSPPNNESRINRAFTEARNVLLIFSVRESGRFAGLARVAAASCRDGPQVSWVLPPGEHFALRNQY